jgi:hypothetical protein
MGHSHAIGTSLSIARRVWWMERIAAFDGSLASSNPTHATLGPFLARDRGVSQSPWSGGHRRQVQSSETRQDIFGKLGRTS